MNVNMIFQSTRHVGSMTHRANLAYKAPSCIAVALALTMFLASSAQARDAVDFVTTPFIDPLNTAPPQLATSTLLPGDSAALSCSENSADSFNLSSSLPSLSPLSLAEAVDIALCRNPQVQTAWASIKVQAAAVGEARAAYFPTLTMGFSRTSNHITTPDSSVSLASTQLSNAQFTTLNWRLLDFGGRDASRRSANALLDAALASHDAVLQKTLGDVISAYFDTQTAQATQLAKQDAEDIARQTLATAQRREAKGAGAQSDTLQATSSLAKTSLERTRAQGAYKKAHAVLVYALGLPAEANLVLPEVHMSPEYGVQQELSTWLAQAQAQHPALVAARLQLTAMQQKLSATRSEGLPTLDFTAGIYLNGRPNQSATSTGTREKPISLTLNIPIFDGYSRTYKIRGVQAQVEQKETELLDLQNQVLMDVVKVHADASAALENLVASEQLKTAAQDALASVQRKFERGAVDILEMLNTQSTLSDAQMERIRSEADWNSAKLRLLAIAGRLGRQALTPN